MWQDFLAHRHVFALDCGFFYCQSDCALPSNKIVLSSSDGSNLFDVTHSVNEFDIVCTVLWVLDNLVNLVCHEVVEASQLGL